jgi:NADH dehydrogenase [ubiquinone] 1 alpha subcomplex assembly factor 5
LRQALSEHKFPVMSAPPFTDRTVPEGFALFDRRLMRARRRRSAAGIEAYGFLLTRAADDMADRLGEIERRFDPVLLQGVRGRILERALEAHPRLGRRLRAAGDASAGPDLVADEEALPFAPSSFAAVLSLLCLHWCNDLPGALIQIRRALKPDGLFIGTLFGGETLRELRMALAEAETGIEGGLSPRISPFLELRDGAGLLQRAGFALPVADRDRITVTYETPLHLMRDLRGMGETNALIERRRAPLKRATLARALEIYGERFRTPGGRIAATFDMLTLTGWAPHESQPRPLKPGSAKTRLAAALGTKELPLKDDPGTD